MSHNSRTKKVSPSPLREEINRIHGLMSQPESAGNTLSNQQTMKHSLDTSPPKLQQRNMIEEYRNKIKSKLGEAATKYKNLNASNKRIDTDGTFENTQHTLAPYLHDVTLKQFADMSAITAAVTSMGNADTTQDPTSGHSRSNSRGSSLRRKRLNASDSFQATQAYGDDVTEVGRRNQSDVLKYEYQGNLSNSRQSNKSLQQQRTKFSPPSALRNKYSEHLQQLERKDRSHDTNNSQYSNNKTSQSPLRSKSKSPKKQSGIHSSNLVGSSQFKVSETSMNSIYKRIQHLRKTLQVGPTRSPSKSQERRPTNQTVQQTISKGSPLRLKGQTISQSPTRSLSNGTLPRKTMNTLISRKSRNDEDDQVLLLQELQKSPPGHPGHLRSKSRGSNEVYSGAVADLSPKLYSLEQSAVDTTGRKNRFRRSLRNDVSVGEQINMIRSSFMSNPLVVSSQCQDIEQKLRAEMENALAEKLVELDEKQVQLDKNLKAVEEARQRQEQVIFFQNQRQEEAQTQQYSDLLSKYNDLLYKFNSMQKQQSATKDFIQHPNTSISNQINQSMDRNVADLTSTSLTNNRPPTQSDDPLISPSTFTQQTLGLNLTGQARPPQQLTRNYSQKDSFKGSRQGSFKKASHHTSSVNAAYSGAPLRSNRSKRRSSNKSKTIGSTLNHRDSKHSRNSGNAKLSNRSRSKKRENDFAYDSTFNLLSCDEKSTLNPRYHSSGKKRSGSQSQRPGSRMSRQQSNKKIGYAHEARLDNGDLMDHQETEFGPMSNNTDNRRIVQNIPKPPSSSNRQRLRSTSVSNKSRSNNSKSPSAALRPRNESYLLNNQFGCEMETGRRSNKSSKRSYLPSQRQPPQPSEQNPALKLHNKPFTTKSKKERCPSTLKSKTVQHSKRTSVSKPRPGTAISYRDKESKKKIDLRPQRLITPGEIDLGFPSVDDVSYLNMLRQQQSTKYHSMCTSEDIDATTVHAFKDMQKKIWQLESEREKQESKIKQLQFKLATRDGQGACCCEELKLLHSQKESQLEQIAECWKSKSSQLANTYKAELAHLRTTLKNVQSNAFAEMDRMRQDQDIVIQKILYAQERLEVKYEKKLRKMNKENKSLNKRVVTHRHALVQQKLAQI